MSASETPSAASYHSLFTEALKNYKRKTGQDPTAQALVVQLGRCTSPEEVTGLLQREAERLDATHKSRWRTRMFEKIAPIVEIIRPLCDTAGKATGLAFQPAETIFGSIGILLTIPDNHMKNHEALIQLLEKMAHFLRRLEILIVPEDVPFDDATTRIIVDILVELIRAFALLTQRTGTSDDFVPKAKRRLRKLLATVSGDKEIEGMLKRLDELTKMEDLMTGALARRDIAIVKREQQRQERMKQAKRYRKWLSPPNSSTNQVTASEARYSDTSMWLVRSEAYEAWKSSGTLLWITGKPGAGKTVICSTVIKDLQDSLRSSRSSVSLAYFFCDFRDTTKQSYRGLLGSLLIDLSTRSDESEDILRKLYSKYKDDSQKPGTDGFKPPEIGDLKKCLKEMLAVRSDDTKYIVVDALDEMPDYGVSSSREKTLELMSWLIGLRLSGLRLCVTGRPEDDIRQVFKSLASHQVFLDEEREHRKDIARLIRSIVETNRKMKGWGETIKEEVIKVLSEKADGMFRYVSCQLDVLCEAPMSKIRSTLKSLPNTLHTTYESTIERISKEKWEDAHRLFQCLSFSTRPLTVEELAGVLAVSVDEEVPIYHDDWRSNDSESVVLSTCPGSFIQIIREDSPFPRWPSRRIVQFAHFSVKEFLTSDQLAKSESRISYFHVRPGSSHAVLAKACLGILLRPDATASTSFQSDLEIYATDSWDAHARFEDVSSSLLQPMKLLFDSTKPHFASWARKRKRYQRPPLGNPLYFAALCDLPPIVEHILTSGLHDVNARGGLHDTAFFAALRMGSVAVIRLLLDGGADINASGGGYGSAIQEAASKGNFDMVQLLLDRGADINASGGGYGSALQLAASHGNLDIVQLLLDRGADINAPGGEYGSALQVAASNGNLDTVKLLLDRGADVNASSGRRGSALQGAASNSKLDLAQLLLDCGANINASGGEYGSALQVAAWNGNLDMVQLLLDRGANINASGGRYGSALQGAASSGMLDIVRLLLDCGADINVQSELYGNMLQAAACNRRKEIDIVQFFLDRGFDVNARGGEFETALIGASHAGNVDIVRLLLASGADTSIRSEKYGTALEAVQASPSWIMKEPSRAAIVEMLSDIPQDATSCVVLPNGCAGSSTQ